MMKLMEDGRDFANAPNKMAAAPLLFLTSISTAFFNPRESAEK
jgi:hypothetical protein